MHARYVGSLSYLFLCQMERLDASLHIEVGFGVRAGYRTGIGLTLPYVKRTARPNKTSLHSPPGCYCPVNKVAS